MIAAAVQAAEGSELARIVLSRACDLVDTKMTLTQRSTRTLWSRSGSFNQLRPARPLLLKR